MEKTTKFVIPVLLLSIEKQERMYLIRDGVNSI